MHDFSFTPSMSIVLEMSSEAELREKYELPAAGGKTLMPLDNYGFRRYLGKSIPVMRDE